MTGWFWDIAIGALVETLLLLAFGYLLADFIVGRWGLGRITTLGLAFPCLVAYSFVLMVAHVTTGGGVLSRPWLVRGLSLAIVIALVVAKMRRRQPNSKPEWRWLIPVVVAVLLGLAVWGLTIVRVVPLALGGDIKWHMGWASQLMNGQSTPNSILTGSIPNYYPWMFHALVAVLASFTPGGHAYHVLPSLQLLQVTAVVLALFALGNVVSRSWIGGAAGALFGAMAGGPLLRTFTSLAAGGRRTYNSSYNNIAPPLPRDIASALFIAFLLLFVLGLLQQRPAMLVSAGIVLGLSGLTSPEWFLVGLVTGALLIVVGIGVPRLTVAGALFVPAFLMVGMWVIPLGLNYVRLGGFVNTTVGQQRILSPITILLSWWLASPLAAYAFVRWLLPRHREPGPRVLMALLVASGGIVLGSSVVRRLLGEGFLPLGVAPRYWPIFYLAVAILAGVGAAQLITALGRRHRVPGALAAAAIVGVSIPVPLSLSVNQARTEEPPEVLHATMIGQQTPFADLASAGRARCVVAAPHPLGWDSFSYTGYRYVAYTGYHGRHRGNFARIRWRDIYRPIGAERQRILDNRILTTGSGSVGKWRDVARKYDVDMVIAHRNYFRRQVFQRVFPRQVEDHRRRGSTYGVFRLGRCDPAS